MVLKFERKTVFLSLDGLVGRYVKTPDVEAIKFSGGEDRWHRGYVVMGYGVIEPSPYLTSFANTVLFVQNVRDGELSQIKYHLCWVDDEYVKIDIRRMAAEEAELREREESP